jgi:putative addiction module component (TIGR02574 family)
MDLQSIITQVESWSVEDRLRLMEQIWEGLLNEGHEPGLTEEQRAEIDRRIAEDEAAPDDVVSWEEVRSDALKRAMR